MKISLLLYNIRSSHNVGSLLRSADGFGAKEVIFSGYTPYPEVANDQRLPHIRRKATNAIHKTALGAENYLNLSYEADPVKVIDKFKAKGWQITGLEQAKSSVELAGFKPKNNILLLLGEEVEGLNDDLISRCDQIIEIPMRGRKESFNVSVAGAIALYQLSR